MSNESKYEYKYPVEELDEIIGKINKGIRPVMTPDLEADLKLRIMELEEELMDEDEVDDYREKHADRMQKKIEQKKRQATKTDVIVIQLSEEQKKQLVEDMSTSIVRMNPDLKYHKRDEELYDSAEKKEIYQKLSRLQKCYYNQKDYVNAVNIIFEAIQYSLKHDYPWMTYEEALKEFNAGRIRFEYCQLPKLMLNWTTVVDNPSTLKGIINGTITVVNSDEDSNKKRKKLPVVPQATEVQVIGDNEWAYLRDLHNRGYNTPITPVIKAETGTFSRFSLPDTNWFYKRKEEQQREPIEFDWMQDGAGAMYYDIIHGTKYTTADLLDDLQADNNGNLNQNLQSGIDDFLAGLKQSPQQSSNPMYQSALVQTPDARAVQMEQSILQAMRNANPNK